MDRDRTEAISLGAHCYLAIERAEERGRDMSWIRRVLTAAAIASLCLPLSGCFFGDQFPPEGLVTGVSRAQDGTPLAVVAVCTGFVNWASLDDITNTSNVTVASTWTSLRNTRGVAVWPLSGDSQWKIAKSFDGLLLGRRYWLGSWGDTGDRDTSNRSSGVEFTAQDLARLAPGEVRFDPRDATGHRTTTMTHFRAQACPPGTRT